jgi:hypothetical protein
MCRLGLLPNNFTNICFFLHSGDGTQGLCTLGKCSTTELHPNEVVKPTTSYLSVKNPSFADGELN